MSSSFENLLIKSLQKTSSEEEEQLLNAWLLEDDGNIELFCQLQEIWNANKKLDDRQITDYWNELIAKSTITDRQSPSHPLRNIINHWKSYAAAILVGFILSTSVWFTFYSTRITTPEIINNNIVYNETGVKKLVLPDSSIVWLNPDSKISYPENFSSDKRLVRLEGKAFFEIRKNKQQPFIVNTDNIDIQVTGTEFFVKSIKDTQEASVTLVSGGVWVKVLQNDGKIITSTHLKPDQQAHINKISGKQTINQVDTNPFVVWKDGEYTFEDELLENIARQFTFRFEKTIEIDPKLKERRFTGKITLNHNLQDVLEIMSYSYAIRYKITDDLVYIYKE